MSIIGKIAEEYGLPARDVAHIVHTAPRRYKVYSVEKRNGRGRRTLAQPSREVKILQYWIIENILRDLPVHNCCRSYRAGMSIKDNASMHAWNKYLLKMDFKDFFPSISDLDFKKHALHYPVHDLSDEDIGVLCNIAFWIPPGESSRRLSIGAPSSPIISNSIMYDIDCAIEKECSSRRVIYTRYADDLSFSTSEPDILQKIQKCVTEIVSSAMYPKLQINEEKTVHTSRGRLRRVTGLTLTSSNTISIGRERKRRIRSLIHHALNGQLDEEEIRSLAGLISFARNIEPEFMERMERRYGAEEIREIVRGHTKSPME